MIVLGLCSCRTHFKEYTDSSQLTAKDRKWREQHLNLDHTLTQTKQLLVSLIQAKSLNPPGLEQRVVTKLKERLEAENIDVYEQKIAQNRSNIYAMIKPDLALAQAPIAQTKGINRKLKNTLCLLSHSDVVPADSTEWMVDPWAGTIKDGYIWGRGALDMKGVTALHVSSLIWLKRAMDHGILKLKRPIAVIVVADEEVSNLGMKALVNDSRHWDRLGCSHLLNEGAFGIKDLLFKGQNVMPISVGEKGVLWVKLTAKGPSGHGSVPRLHYAPAILLKAIKRIQQREIRPSISQPLTEMFARVGANYGGVSGFVLQRPLLTRWFALNKILSVPESAAGVSNTFHITGFHAAQGKPNVVPSEATLTLDIRVLPNHKPQNVLTELKTLVDDERISIEVITSIPSEISGWQDDPIFDALMRQSIRVFPNAVAGPVTSVGFTDSTFARQKGVKAYGWVPFMLHRDELATMHGPNERVSLSQLKKGLDATLTMLLESSAVLIHKSLVNH